MIPTYSPKQTTPHAFLHRATRLLLAGLALLSAPVQAAITASVTPASLTFAAQGMNTVSPAQTVTLSNTGTAALSISSLVMGGTNPAQFTLSGSSTCKAGLSVAVGGSCTIALQFSPTPNQAPGAKSATLTITDNATPTTQVISLSGTTVMPANTTVTTSASTLAFSAPSLASSPLQTLSLKNTGTLPLVIYAGAISLAGTNPGQFALTAGSTCINTTSGVSVPAGGSCTVNVQYKPTAAAVVGTTYRANVSFNLNTATQPVVTLTGVPNAAAKVYYLHTDHLDTPRSITNTAGQEVWRWDNTDPFGNNLANENPSALGTFTFNLRFPGQYFDKETGLHYNVNRDYNPGLGRYIQSDPIGLRGGINTYAYVEGNPLLWIDFVGLCDTKKCRGYANFSAVGPNQAPHGALGFSPPVGTVAINPAIFGLPYDTIPERVQTQKYLAKYGSQISISAPRLNLGENGPTSSAFTVGDVGNKDIRNSPIPRFDIYRYSDQADALKFSKQKKVLTTITLPADLLCPPGFEEIK